MLRDNRDATWQLVTAGRDPAMVRAFPEGEGGE